MPMIAPWLRAQAICSRPPCGKVFSISTPPRKKLPESTWFCSTDDRPSLSPRCLKFLRARAV